MKNFPDVPPVWALAAAALAWGLARWAPIWDLSSPHLTRAGWLFMLGGLGLIFWSAQWFRRKSTTIAPGRTPTALIIEGPFRFSRNPIYLGMTIFLVGFAFWTGALSAIIPVFAFTTVIKRRFILPEEAALREAFGAEAERYLSATRRW